MANDYPDGFRRLLPGHTVDLTSGFARPWHMGTTINIAGSTYSTYTITITDPDSIYYIDAVNASPQAFTQFGIRVFLGGVVYVAGGFTGYAQIPMRVNPSIFLLYGDVIEVEISNYDDSLRQFLVHVHGTKITKPAGFGRVPGAYFTAASHISDVLTGILLTDGSSPVPTSWEWDFRDGQPKATTQNPYALYKTPGSYYPLLKAFNEYGYDTFAEQVPIVCNSELYPINWSEYDPFSNITLGVNSVTITATPSNYGIFSYMDLLGRESHAFMVTFALQTTLMQANSRHCFMKFGSSLSAEDAETIGSVGVEIVESAGHNIVLLRATLPGGALDDGYDGIVADGTPLYFKLYHASGADTVSLNIYSDAAQTVLLAALSLTSDTFKTLTYRYIYLTRGSGGVTTGQITAVISHITYYYL